MPASWFAGRFPLALPWLLCCGSLSCVPAIDLPGIPGPQPLGDADAALAWGNDAFGPGGGGTSDDFRTNQLSLSWQHHGWVAGLDHSMLTVSNPSNSPVYWGLPDPYIYANAGAIRHDEVTASLSWRHGWSKATWHGWMQIGAGALALGNLGGEQLQSFTHATLGQLTPERRHEMGGLRLEGVVTGGAGIQRRLAGPLHLDVSALGAEVGGHWRRLRTEALALAAGPGGGMWLGLRLDASEGDTLSRTHDAVAAHEDGPMVIAGWGTQVRSVRLSIVTTRHLQHEHQEGTLAVAYAPRPGTGGGSDELWLGRFGLVAHDSLVGRRGTDVALGRRLGTGPWLLWLGYRDQEPVVPYAMDLNARRQMLWAGLGAAPELPLGGPIALVGLAEAGAGWRHSRVRSKGFLLIDGGDETQLDAAVARVAVGGCVMARSHGAELGLMTLVEGIASSVRHDTRLTVLDPYALIVRKETDMPIEGHAISGIVGLLARWRW